MNGLQNSSAMGRYGRIGGHRQPGRSVGSRGRGFETAGPPKGNGGYQSYNGKPKGVRISISYDQDDKAYGYAVELPEKGGEKLVAAWGPRPGKARGLGSPMNCWDLADGTRIELDSNRVTYTTPDRGVCEVQ